MQPKGNVSTIITEIKYMIEFIFIITLRRCFIVQLFIRLNFNSYDDNAKNSIYFQ